MILLIIFSFIAGFVTILSPCILPILPIVLSGSLSGGHRRPLGIITGFVISFTFFTLFLASLVQLIGISADALRMLSVLILFIFGISLLSTKIQTYFEIAFSKLAFLAPKKNEKSGFFGGVVIGVSLGLVWTPCVGPILAAVISLALTGTVTGSALLITLSYSLGTAIPMFVISYGGRALMQKVPFITKNTGKIQKLFGVLMIIMSIAIYLNIDRRIQTLILDKYPLYSSKLTSLEDNQAVHKELDKLINTSKIVQEGETMIDIIEENVNKAPDFIPTGEWINSDPLTMSKLRGKVVLVDFWTYTCINCIRTLPYIREWDQKYREEGLVIVGVHTPEFEFEKSIENVKQAVSDYGLNYPIFQDNDFKTWRAYNNRYWPAKYLIDKNGGIRYTHIGEGNYDETEREIQKLLKEAGSESALKVISNAEYDVFSRTPELYLGTSRLEALSSTENVKHGGNTEFTKPANIPNNTFALSGVWFFDEEYAQPAQNSKLYLNFESKDVYLVLKPIGNKDGTIIVKLDGQDITREQSGNNVNNGRVAVTKDMIYHLISLPDQGKHELELTFPEGNVRLFAFTFG